MKCPYHYDEPSISCFRCISDADEQDVIDNLVIDEQRERVLSRLRDVEAAVEELRNELELYDEHIDNQREP